jgi:hypothetical protein|tara:strand:+ start:269 stop:484 length:216 start_codon:yes stop_codon:yes gene_type:complete
MIKTNKKVIHLIHGLLALSAVNNDKDRIMVEDALKRAKKKLSDHEILIGYYAFEAQKEYMDYLKDLYKKIK